MAGKFDGLRNLLPVGFIGLGNFVLYPNDPFKSYFAPKDTPRSATLKAYEARDFDTRVKEGGGSLLLGQIISAGCWLKSEASVDLDAATSTVHKMVNYDSYFDQVCKSTEVRGWFEKQLEKYGASNLKLYLVIGLQTVKDASLVTVAEVFGDPGVLSKLLDPSVEVDVKLVRESGQRFSVAEAVYAVRYATVSFKYKSSRILARLLGKMQLTRSSLETNTRWIVMGTDAGGPSVSDEDELEDEEDMIEAEIVMRTSDESERDI